MQTNTGVHIFEENRPILMGLAYRILGSRADAEDAVQDTFLKWQKAEKSRIENPVSWLTTVCTRRCIDLLRSAHKTRVDYVGPWLPEPLQTPVGDDPEQRLFLASSLGTAFLLMLERLTPKERAAYLLHEIFEASYPEIAQTLDIKEATCRKLVSRARSNIKQTKVRNVTPIDQQEKLLAAFEVAIANDDTTQLASLLSDDIKLFADGGGKVPAIHYILHGQADVLNFIEKGLGQWWRDHQWVGTDINGSRGIILKENDTTAASVSFAYDDAGKATDIFIMRNPDKLGHMEIAEIA